VAQETRVFEVEARDHARLRSELESAGLQSRSVPHALFSFASKEATATLYKSGKLVVQGPEIAMLLERLFPGASGPVNSADLEDRLGSDEVGKGDYFGPVVVVCAYVPPEERERARKLGVTDSKNLADDSILRIAGAISHFVPYELISLPPSEYNRRWESLRNINHLLAELHAEAMVKLSARLGKREVLLDKFADPARLRVEVAKLGADLDVVARTKAEANVSVAAASILAREAFLEGLKSLSDEAGLDLPKGASDLVITAARKFVRIHGPAKLSQFAKVHFRTTERVLGNLPFSP